MADFLDAYSIQRWLESCPQSYLMNTVYGHAPDEKEPEILLENDVLREDAIRVTCQLVAGERCALLASSGLVGCAPDEASQRFLATQTLDEARHVEIFTQRLYDLGVRKEDLEATIAHHVNPNLKRFAEVLLEKVAARDFIAGVVGQNVVLEGMAFSVFEMLYATNAAANPKFGHVLRGTIADERRHVGFGENRIGQLIAQHPEKKPAVERMQKEMSWWMLATFADSFQQANSTLTAFEEAGGERDQEATFHGVSIGEMEPSEMEHLLSDTILADFRSRLTRIGIEYQTPDRPGA